jgi:beta-N-acetylhexosaminidase
VLSGAQKVASMALSRRSLLIAGLVVSSGVGSAIAAGPATTGSVARAGASGEGLAVEALVGQMLMVGFRGDEPNTPGGEAVRSWLAAGKIGGVIFYEDNLASPAATLRLTRAFRQAAGPKRTPLIAVDQEGGAVARLRPERGFKALPSAREVAARYDVGEAFARYADLAEDLSKLGFNVNFGPVVDLDLNWGSNIISGLGRSFGTDAIRSAI